MQQALDQILVARPPPPQQAARRAERETLPCPRPGAL